jgi:hypothetical protein
VDEFAKLEWSRINDAKVEIFLLEVGSNMVDACANVPGLRAKEKVGNKLNSVDLVANPRQHERKYMAF